MIISKKKFKEEIDKAVNERENEIWRQKDLDDRFRYLHNDFDRLCERVYAIELKTGIRSEEKSCCDIPVCR